MPVLQAQLTRPGIDNVETVEAVAEQANGPVNQEQIEEDLQQVAETGMDNSSEDALEATDPCGAPGVEGAHGAVQFDGITRSSINPTDLENSDQMHQPSGSQPQPHGSQALIAATDVK